MPLEAKNIYFRYDRKQSWILEDCSVRVDRGECLAISAPSGYGKTTLAMLLSGYIKPVKGEILIDGKALPEKGVCPVRQVTPCRFLARMRCSTPRVRCFRILS